MNDTPKEIEKRYREMIMQRSPEERLYMMSGMYDAAKELAIAGIRMEKGNLEPLQLRIELFLRMYGGDFTETEKAKIIKHLSGTSANGTV